MRDPLDLAVDVTLQRDGHTCRLVLWQRAHANSPWVQLAYADGRIAAVNVLRALEAAVDARTGIDDAIATLIADGWTVAAPPLQVEPPQDLRLTVESLMEALNDQRQVVDGVDPTGTLRRRYESFRTALERAGFAVTGFERADRGARQRRLGELAELRGDFPGALRHYEAALLADPNVGEQTRLAWLRAHWTAAPS
jgi:hypothetical protein